MLLRPRHFLHGPTLVVEKSENDFYRNNIKEFNDLAYNGFTFDVFSSNLHIHE